MSTPDYAARVINLFHGTNSRMLIDPDQRQPGRVAAEEQHYLPLGECWIVLTYDGPEAAEVWWESDGTSATRHAVCSIPAGSGPRFSRLVKLPVSNPLSRIAVLTNPRSSTLTGSTASASVQIVPSERYTP